MLSYEILIESGKNCLKSQGLHFFGPQNFFRIKKGRKQTTIFNYLLFYRWDHLILSKIMSFSDPPWSPIRVFFIFFVCYMRVLFWETSMWIIDFEQNMTCSVSMEIVFDNEYFFFVRGVNRRGHFFDSQGILLQKKYVKKFSIIFNIQWCWIHWPYWERYSKSPTSETHDLLYVYICNIWLVGCCWNFFR